MNLFDRFEVLRERPWTPRLSRGSIARAFEAFDTASKRSVVVRSACPNLWSDPNFKERVERRQRALRDLDHEHAVRVYEIGEKAGWFYVVTELRHSACLDTMSGSLIWPRVVEILVQLCAVLHAIHLQGIVYRDLAPEDVYLARAPSPQQVEVSYREAAPSSKDHVALDIGVAFTEPPPPDPTKLAVGDLAIRIDCRIGYWSPEQMMRRAVDPRSDVYSLGVLAYELVTGQRPFADARGEVALLTAQLKRSPEPPSRLASIPKALEQIILACLEREPRNRPSDAIALRDALTGA